MVRDFLSILWFYSNANMTVPWEFHNKWYHLSTWQNKYLLPRGSDIKRAFLQTTLFSFYLWTCYCNVRLCSILFGFVLICFVFNMQCRYSYNEVPVWYRLFNLMSYIWDHKVLNVIWLISFLLLPTLQWTCHCCLCQTFLVFGLNSGVSNHIHLLVLIS